MTDNQCSQDEKKAWLVGPYNEDWVTIMHAATRGKARQKGMLVEFSDFTNMRAIRLPKLDGKLITMDLLLESGFPTAFDGFPLDVADYVFACCCELCKKSVRVAQGKRYSSERNER
jgi:hypothetical protein